MSDSKPVDIPSKPPVITNEESPMPGGAEDGNRHQGGVGDLVRKAVMAGVGAVFLTEEGIRKTVSELKLPKEAFGYLASQADKTRQEASRIVRKELRRFLNSDAFKEQMMQALGGLTLEIKAEVRLKPDTRTPKPDVNARVRVKSTVPEEHAK
jgi:hypothetical protein